MSQRWQGELGKKKRQDVPEYIVAPYSKELETQLEAKTTGTPPEPEVPPTLPTIEEPKQSILNRIFKR